MHGAAGTPRNEKDGGMAMETAATLFEHNDRETMRAKGLDPEEVERQIGLFQKGFCAVRLARPCTDGDGIEVIEDDRMKALVSLYEAAQSAGRITKFVPASGAASRMFRDWFRFRRMPDFEQSDEGRRFKEHLPRYPFYDSLARVIEARGQSLQELESAGNLKAVLDYILSPRGLDYGALPKALLGFHRYTGHTRTPLEEHLVEAALHGTDRQGIARIHFTVSPEHAGAVEAHIRRIRGIYEKNFSVVLDISLSTQLPSTDTIAVTLDNRPFRDDQGTLIFRPGGHGALIKNLNRIEGDIIFLKNIDNVVPDRLKAETILFKKILGGLLVELQDEIFRYLHTIDQNAIDEKALLSLERFCRGRLGLAFPSAFQHCANDEKIQFFFSALHRPLRICGMVKNEGEPGGGPFWVHEKTGSASKQIIESAQIDSTSSGQMALWNASTHFNPVDLVCGVRDHRGDKFDLEQFIDADRYLISEKSHEGRALKALEHPGLWNGAMARWNTVFVEVPLWTFAPVKTVEDLLRPEHRP